MSKRVLVLEPYYGGSHRAFLNGLVRHVRADFVLLTLPARKWKMRMQLSALWFVEQMEKMLPEDRRFDAILCSTFVDVAVLRALLCSSDWWLDTMPILVYFHENQFSYPVRVADSGMHQFTAINFTTALGADALAFNSRYNLESFLQGVTGYLKKAADMRFHGVLERIRQKATVLYPGLDYSFLEGDGEGGSEAGGAPVILWNHRWEHDKGPEHFFSALYRLREKKIPFRLIILGQSFRDQPPCFEEARQRLADQILHFGYVESRQEYGCWLRRADIVVSTARHEFFGLAVIEAVRAGCYPLLPDRLSYPELFDQHYLYGKDQLTHKLGSLLCCSQFPSCQTALTATDRFQWTHVCTDYENWLFGGYSHRKEERRV